MLSWEYIWRKTQTQNTMSPILFTFTRVYLHCFSWWINSTTSVRQYCTVRKELQLGLESLWEECSHCLTFGCNSVLKIHGTFPEVSFIANGGWGAGVPGDPIGTLELGSCRSWPGRLSTYHMGSLGIVLSLLFCCESIRRVLKSGILRWHFVCTYKYYLLLLKD